jgi:hypothetical protein
VLIISVNENRANAPTWSDYAIGNRENVAMSRDAYLAVTASRRQAETGTVPPRDEWSDAVIERYPPTGRLMSC